MTHLPSFCPEHPKAKLRVEWDSYPAETEKKFYCAECGMRLCSEKEFKRRAELNKMLIGVAQYK